jgi:transcriptional regulator with XRE-family HTH domain
MEDDKRREIGQRLKEFRLSLKLTQLGLARHLKVQRQSVSAWENGKSMPMCEDWLKLGQIGMSLDYVVLGIRTMPVSDYARPYLGLRVREIPPAGELTPLP